MLVDTTRVGSSVPALERLASRRVVRSNAGAAAHFFALRSRESESRKAGNIATLRRNFGGHPKNHDQSGGGEP